MLKNFLTYSIFLIFMMPVTLLSQENKTELPDSARGAGKDSAAYPVEQIRKRENPRTDTIFFFGKKSMNVHVMKITYDSVLYREPGETEILALDKDIVNKIKYNWGRLEILNEKEKEPRKFYDWRKVKVLDSKNEVEGLFRVEEVTAKAKGSGRGYETPRSLETKATIILKKKAANLNAQYVVITNKTITTAFGESPSATLKGIVYTTDKGKKEPSPEK